MNLQEVDQKIEEIKWDLQKIDEIIKKPCLLIAQVELSKKTKAYLERVLSRYEAIRASLE